MVQDLKKIKTMGGIGSILTLLGGLPYVGSLVYLAGEILVLIALWDLKKITQEKSIFKNYLVGVILSSVGVIGLIIGIVLVSVGLIALFTREASRESFEGRGMMPLAFSVLILLFSWALFVFGNYLIMKSFKKVTEVTKEEKFATAGLLYFIGALTLILLVGALISFAGMIVTIVAFFSLPDKAEVQVA